MPQPNNAIEETTPYFESEYELELERWVRRRFRNLCIALLTVLCGLWVLVIVEEAIRLFSESGETTSTAPGAYAYVSSFIYILTILWFLVIVRPQLETKDQLIRSATGLIMILSIVAVLGQLAMRFFSTHGTTAPLGEMFFFHFIACLFLPWTPWQSLKAIGPAFLLWFGDRTSLILGQAIAEEASWGFLVAVILSTLFMGFFAVLIFIPGMILCWMRLRRHGRRFKMEMLGRQFLSMRKELKQARRIHDALFPEQVTNPYFRFQFKYTPHTDIGGDFVFFDTSESMVRVILIDVTGHGLTAAMTVNRIHGELERIRGEHPDGDPAIFMSLLDRYFVLTLAPHNIFATGLAFDLDLKTGRLRWVNSGHPPAFIISPDNSVRELETTTVMLGAMGPNDFDPEQQEMQLAPQDSIVAYTDGVTEARNAQGTMLGLTRLREVINSSRGETDWPDRIQTLVRTHARGAFEDDVLIVSLDYAQAIPPSGSLTEIKTMSQESTRA